MKKTKTLSKVKKEAWTVFSLYIRTRDALRTTGTKDEALCITCERRYPIKQLQAGHWLPARHNSVLFNERNCHGQCYGCNVPMKSNPIKYWHFMEKTYGTDVMAILEELDSQTKQFKVFELEALKEEFKQKLKAL